MMKNLKAFLAIVSVFTVIFFVAERSEASLIAGPDIIAAPSSVVDDFPGAENTHQQAFDEKQGVILADPVEVDGGEFIAAGTWVSSHMIFLNTDGDAPCYDLALWQFDGDVLGVMSDTYGELEEKSNAALGAPGTIYPGSFDLRGFESAEDDYIFLGDKIAVAMKVTEPGDWIRVVTAAVPIPSAAWLFGSGLIGLIALRRRFRL